MARAQQNKLYNVFVKGLITEASALTYPENATIAEDNCLLSRKGNRSRRLGINREYGGSLTSVAMFQTGFDNLAINEFRWESVANVAGLDYLVVQIGLRLYFFDLQVDQPVSSGDTGLNLDLTAYVRSGATAPESEIVQMASGKGLLFVVGPHLEPVMVEYNRDTNVLTASRVYIQIRDFKGLDDGLANDQEPTTLSNPHLYNLLNQGWYDPANTGAGASVTYYNFFGEQSTYIAPTYSVITAYHTHSGRYPPNSKQWWTAKTSSGNFDPQLLEKLYTGSARAPRGHFIVDAFNIDRGAVSGVSGLDVESTYERPVTVSFFGGRVWYATNSTVYFSQVLDDKRRAGMCYQEADPTAEDISDLIGTDGGVIPIPEMAKAVRLVPAGAGILVFATNGIWSITGTSSGFTATDISVSKVSPIGTDSPQSIVEAEGQFYWWSKIGVMGMNQNVGIYGPIEGSYQRTNISESTIQTLYNSILPNSKRYAKGVFDSSTNTIQWLYSSSSGARHRYDKILNLDLTLQAFYPFTISSSVAQNTPWVVGVFATSFINDLQLAYDGLPELTFVKYMTVTPNAPEYRIAFASFNDTTFQDWGTQAYTSYIETGYELLQDAMRDKQATWVYTYFRRTEELFVLSGSEYTMNHQSSCHFQAKWDWSDSPVSNRWSNKEQAYKYQTVPVVDENNLTVDNGYAVIVSKHKVRGSGKSIQFRFECSEPNRDFDLLGWSTNYTGNTNV